MSSSINNTSTAVPATTTSTNTSSSLTSTDPAKLQKEFITLLVAQLKNQDPSNPMDNSAMVGQMAQLSQVEAATNLNTTMANGLSQSSMLSAANKIGSKVLAPGSTISLTNGRADFGVNISNPSDSTKVNIEDLSGNIIDTIDLGPQSGGLVPLSWDGKTTSGSTAPDGNYKFSVIATNKSTVVPTTSLSVGTLQAVSQATNGIVEVSVTGIGSKTSSGTISSVTTPLSSIQQFL